MAFCQRAVAAAETEKCLLALTRLPEEDNYLNAPRGERGSSAICGAEWALMAAQRVKAQRGELAYGC